MGILIAAVAVIFLFNVVARKIGNGCPPLGNFIFKFGKLIGLLLLAGWLYFMIHNDTKNTGTAMFALGLGFLSLPMRKRFGAAAANLNRS